MTKGSAKREEKERNLREGERKKERERKKEGKKRERKREKQRMGHIDPADGVSTTEALCRPLFKTKFSPPGAKFLAFYAN